MNSFNTVIFDLDGTIVDTEAAAAHVVQKCFVSWNVPLDPLDATFITGRTWESAFEYLFKKYRLPVSDHDAGDTILKAYRVSIEDELLTVPGSVTAVKSLSPHYPLGLVSGSSRADILFALRKLGIDGCFQVILGAEDYPRSKPEPDGYLKAVSILGTVPKKGLVFEDSKAGISSARNAGLWVVAIAGTNHFHQDQTEAHHQIPDLSAVDAAWVASLAVKLGA